jgi:hypothetical protein
VFAIADSVPVIFQNNGIRVRGGIGFSVNNVGYNELASVLPKKTIRSRATKSLLRR